MHVRACADVARGTVDFMCVGTVRARARVRVRVCARA